METPFFSGCLGPLSGDVVGKSFNVSAIFQSAFLPNLPSSRHGRGSSKLEQQFLCHPLWDNCLFCGSAKNTIKSILKIDERLELRKKFLIHPLQSTLGKTFFWFLPQIWSVFIGVIFFFNKLDLPFLSCSFIFSSSSFPFRCITFKENRQMVPGTVTCFPNWVLDFIRSRGRANYNLSKFKTSDCYSIEIGQIAINWNFLLPNFNSIWEMSMIIWPRSRHKVTLSQSLQFR